MRDNAVFFAYLAILINIYNFSIKSLEFFSTLDYNYRGLIYLTEAFMKKNKLIYFVAFLLLSGMTLLSLASCNTSGGDDGSGQMLEIAPTILDIAEERIETTKNETFTFEIYMAWENWEWGPDRSPSTQLAWNLICEDYETSVNPYNSNMEMPDPSGDGWLRYYFTFELSIDRVGEFTLEASNIASAAIVDSVTVIVTEGSSDGGSEGDGGNNDGDSGEYQPCPEENLQLTLDGDHYIVTGIGTYQLGSVDVGTYLDKPLALNIYNKPNGIPITEIAEGAFAGLELTHFGSSTVTKIGDRAFSGCTSLEALIIEHETPVEFGAYAFEGCDSFSYLWSQAKIKAIGEFAFASLPSFKAAQGGDGTMALLYTDGAIIGAHAFEGCNGFTYLTNSGGSSDITVGEYAFANCTALDSVWGFAAKNVGAHAFEGCYNISSGAPVDMEIIGDYAFAGCEKLQYLVCDNTVEIGDYAFAVIGRTVNGSKVYNYALYSVELNGGATKIGTSAFENNAALETVTVNGNVGVIGTEAFDNCKGLYSFSVEGSVNEVLAGAFSSCGSKVRDYIINQGKNYLAYHVTGGTKILREGAFGGALLSELDLTKTEVIEGKFSFGGEVRLTLPSYFTEIPDEMFASCSGLYGLTFTSDITKIGVAAFAGCPLSDSDFTIPDTVTRIEERAFYNCSLTNGDLPDSLTYIGARAFYGEKNFKETTVKLPAKLVEIGESAFENSSLERLEAAAPTKSKATFYNMTIWRNVFRNCKKLESVDFTGWNYRYATYSVSTGMFDGCSALTTVDLGYVSFIGVEAFKGCSAVESFKAIPTNLNGDNYPNTATGFVIYIGNERVSITLEMLADAAAMAEKIRNGIYDEGGWNAYVL